MIKKVTSQIIKAFFSIFILCTLLVSCKKDYTCECRNPSGDLLESYTIKESNNNAKFKCETASMGISSTGVTCNLK